MLGGLVPRRDKAPHGLAKNTPLPFGCNFLRMQFQWYRCRICMRGLKRTLIKYNFKNNNIHKRKA